MSKSCLECYYRMLSRDNLHCSKCDASGSGFFFDTHGETKSTYGLCGQCGTYHVSGEKCPVIYRITPKMEKPIDFNFYWEILSAWVLAFKPHVSVYQLRGLCERLTTITASNIGLDPINALHCIESKAQGKSIDWDNIDDEFDKFLEGFHDVEGERYERRSASDGGEWMKHRIRQAMNSLENAREV